jgi:hypothetical protein
MVGLLAAPLAAVATLVVLGVLGDAISSSSTAVGNGVAVLALAVAPVMTWRTAARVGYGRKAVGPIVASVVITAAMFGGLLLALVLETSPELGLAA